MNRMPSTGREEKRTPRHSGIELLRLLCAVGIIILHYCNREIGGAFSFAVPKSPNEHVLILFESLCIASVNTLVMISGYFMCLSNKRRLSKVVKLFVQVSAFNILYFVFRIAAGQQQFSAKSLLADAIPINYFVSLYCAVYIVSPYVNILLAYLSQRGALKFLGVIFSVFSIYSFLIDLLENWIGVATINALSSVGIGGSQTGCTVVNFLLAYIIGACIRIHKFQIRRIYLLLSIVGIIGILYGWSVRQIYTGRGTVCWNYNNPLCLILAAAWLMLFLRLDFTSRIINELAQAVFSSVLCHSQFFPYLGIPLAVSRSGSYLIAHICGSCCVLYLISYVVHKAYHLIADHTYHRIIGKIDYYNLLSDLE